MSPMRWYAPVGIVDMAAVVDVTIRVHVPRIVVADVATRPHVVHIAGVARVRRS